MTEETQKKTNGGELKVPVHRPDHAEIARRLTVEVERLSHQPDWLYWVSREDHANDFGVDTTTLKKMVEAKIKANEKAANDAKAELRRQEDRAAKAAEAKRKEEAKAAAAKVKQRDKELAKIAKLPKAGQDIRLDELAKRTGDDVDALRDELPTTAAGAAIAGDTLEPWPEPVDTAMLLNEAMAKLRRYIVIHDDNGAIAIVLWVAFAWIHDDIAVVHSPILYLTSADWGEAKSTTSAVIGLMAPKACLGADLTSASLYRYVDQEKPTLIIDNADRLFERRPDLAEIVNAHHQRKLLRLTDVIDLFDQIQSPQRHAK